MYITALRNNRREAGCARFRVRIIFRRRSFFFVARFFASYCLNRSRQTFRYMVFRRIFAHTSQFCRLRRHSGVLRGACAPALCRLLRLRATDAEPQHNAPLPTVGIVQFRPGGVVLGGGSNFKNAPRRINIKRRREAFPRDTTRY